MTVEPIGVAMSTCTSKDGGGGALADEDIVMKKVSKEKNGLA
jgi:hypothetical protein